MIGVLATARRTRRKADGSDVFQEARSLGAHLGFVLAAGGGHVVDEIGVAAAGGAGAGARPLNALGGEFGLRPVSDGSLLFPRSGGHKGPKKRTESSNGCNRGGVAEEQAEA